MKKIYQGAQKRSSSYRVKEKAKVGILMEVTSELGLNTVFPGRRTMAGEVAKGKRKSPGSASQHACEKQQEHAGIGCEGGRKQRQ